MSAPAAHPIRLLIVDDSPLIRAGLRAVLEAHDEVTIVGEAGTATEGLAAVMQHKPDVVLLDLRLPDRPGLSACRDILARRPGTRVIILTSATDERNVHEAIAVGAHGYLLKENDGASLVAAITRVAAGHSVLDPSLADQMLNLMKRGLGSTASQLAIKLVVTNWLFCILFFSVLHCRLRNEAHSSAENLLKSKAECGLAVPAISND